MTRRRTSVYRNRKRNKSRKLRKLRGGQYLSNVGYSTGYSQPFFKAYVSNIV